jgi:hypothetical protein
MLESTDCIGLSSAPPTPRHTPPPLPELPTAILLGHATAGRLRDAHETLCLYMLNQTPDPTTGGLELRLFYESTKAAITCRHAAPMDHNLEEGEQCERE